MVVLTMTLRCLRDIRGDYTFASSEDGLTVTVTDRSTGDADTVTNVETLSFDDGDIAVSHDGSGWF